MKEYLTLEKIVSEADHESQPPKLYIAKWLIQRADKPYEEGTKFRNWALGESPTGLEKRAFSQEFDKFFEHGDLKGIKKLKKFFKNKEEYNSTIKTLVESKDLYQQAQKGLSKNDIEEEGTVIFYRKKLYQKAEGVLKDLKGSTFDYSGATHKNRYGVEADFLSLYTTYRTQQMDRKFTEALSTLDGMLGYLNNDNNKMKHRKDLKASLLLEKARIFIELGGFDLAIKTANLVDENYSHGGKEDIKGEAYFKNGNYKEAFQNWNTALQKNPEIEGVIDGLIMACDQLPVKTPPNLKTNYSKLDEGTRKLIDEYYEAMDKFDNNDVKGAEKKFNDLLVKVKDNKTQEGRAIRAGSNHTLANISRLGGDLKTAADYTLQSYANFPTKESVVLLKDTYHLMK